jgi:hypothetical protein
MKATGAVMTITMALTTVGCATADGVAYTPVNDSPRVLTPRPSDSVDVYFDKPPSRVHVDVGVFEIYQGQMDNGTGHSTGEMFQTLRLHGSLRGCDALRVLGIELGGTYRTRVVRAVCEIYNDEEGVRAAATLRRPAPLPGEGKSCGAESDRSPMITPRCIEPLVCENRVCTLPYK